MTLVDLTKAFDTVNRDGHQNHGQVSKPCPPSFIATVRQFHGGMQARVQNNRELSEPLTNRVKQVQTDVLDELLYADGMDKNASSEAKMLKKGKMEQVIIMISQNQHKKTEVVHLSEPGKPYNELGVLGCYLGCLRKLLKSSGNARFQTRRS